MTSDQPSSRLTPKRLILLALFAVFLLILLWLGLKTWRISQTSQALLARQAEIETLLAEGLTHLDPDAAEQLVLATRSDIYTLQKETAVFMPLTPYLGWLPKVGSTLTAAPQLMEMAVAGSDSAAYALRGLKPALVLMQTEGAPDRIAGLVHILSQAAPDLQAAQETMAQVSAARAAINNEADLSWRLRQMLGLADEWLPLAQKGLALSTVIPEIMGQNGPRTYLLIAQNEDERRATGGFISGAGTITVENGRLSEINMLDAYAVDNFREKPYDVVPPPLADYMGLDLFLFRDANFWPDFPTSANKAMDLFSYGQDLPPLDGAIAIDQEFLRLLVAATGPIPLADSDEMISSKNLINKLRDAWASGDEGSDTNWVWVRKAFIGVFANAIRDHIENNPEQIDFILLTQNMAQALEGRHLQLYLRQPHVQTVLAETGWNGRLANPAGQDFLAVVDTNMGFNKSNLHVKRETDYHVTLAENGDGNGRLTVTYSHTGTDTGKPCIQEDPEAYQGTPDYLRVADGCYFNYLRLYLPETIRLTEASQHSTAGDFTRTGQPIVTNGEIEAELPGFTTVSNFFMVPIGKSVASQFRYTLPAISQAQEDGNQRYQLFVRKQAGSDPESVTITVTLPAGATFLSAIPTPTTIEGKTLTFALHLDSDKLITVNYQ